MNLRKLHQLPGQSAWSGEHGWTARRMPKTPLTRATLQSNRCKLQQTSANFLMHYRFKDQWFGIAGPAIHSQTFKRWNIQPGLDQATNITGQVLDEASSEIQAQLGVAFETENIRHIATSTGLRMYLVKPVWRHVDNTLAPDVTFSGIGGYDAVIEGRYRAWR